MAVTHRHHLRRYSGEEQKRGVRVPQVVIPDPGKVALANETIESLGDHIDVVCSPILTREHEAGFVPLALKSSFFEPASQLHGVNDLKQRFDRPVSTGVVRYRPKADRADGNQRLVEAVFADSLPPTQGGALCTPRLADFWPYRRRRRRSESTRKHQCVADFQKDIADRCEPGKGPNPQPATVVDSYRFFAGS